MHKRRKFLRFLLEELAKTTKRRTKAELTTIDRCYLILCNIVLHSKRIELQLHNTLSLLLLVNLSLQEPHIMQSFSRECNVLAYIVMTRSYAGH